MWRFLPLVYDSSDGARSWTIFPVATDQVNAWGLRYQHFLYELPVDLGGFPPDRFYVPQLISYTRSMVSKDDPNRTFATKLY